MDKKKIFKIGIVALGIILIIAFCVVLFTKKDGGEEFVKAKPINEKVNLEQVFAEIEKIEGFEVYDDNFESDEIDFGKYSTLDRKAIVFTTDNEVNEVWMVKLSDFNQQEDVMRIFGNRIQKLRNGFEDSKEQLSVLNEAVVKQEDGIVIMIASTDVYEIEKTIASQMEVQ